MPAPTKRQFNAALKAARADRKVPMSDDFTTHRYGEGYSADYVIYWRGLGLTASFRQRADRTFYLGYADEIAAGSHMDRHLVGWEVA